MLVVNFTPFPTLETERLSLREITMDDAASIYYLRSNPRVMKYIDRDPLKNEQEGRELTQKIVDTHKNNDGIMWGISRKGDHELVGTIGFWRINKEDHRAEIGYMLRPDLHGQGYMHEAMTSVMEYGWKYFRFHSVEANCNPGNQESMRLLERNGFVKEAYHRENYHYNGRFIDSVIYAIITPIK